MTTLNGTAIPLEMLREVAKSLTDRDKRHLLLVSQAFHDIFAVDVYEEMNLCSLRAWKVLLTFARGSKLSIWYASLVKNLSFTSCKGRKGDLLFYPLLCDTLLLFPNLKVLKLTLLAETQITKGFVELVRRWGLVDGLRTRTAAPLSHLRRMVIDGAPPLLELAHNRHLHYLWMRLDGFVESSSYIATTFRCMNIGRTLMTLELLNISASQTAELFDAASTRCPYLQALSLSHARMDPLVGGLYSSFQDSDNPNFLATGSHAGRKKGKTPSKSNTLVFKRSCAGVSAYTDPQHHSG